MRDALFANDEDCIQKELEKWNPIIEMSFTPERVDQTIEDFGKVVDAIEENEFAAPPKGKLEKKIHGSERAFGVKVCGNCDARFSCNSFRKYAIDPNRKSRIKFAKYFKLPGDDLEQEQWINANLDALEERVKTNY